MAWYCPRSPIIPACVPEFIQSFISIKHGLWTQVTLLLEVPTPWFPLSHIVGRALWVAVQGRGAHEAWKQVSTNSHFGRGLPCTSFSACPQKKHCDLPPSVPLLLHLKQPRSCLACYLVLTSPVAANLVHYSLRYGQLTDSQHLEFSRFRRLNASKSVFVWGVSPHIMLTSIPLEHG